VNKQGRYDICKISPTQPVFLVSQHHPSHQSANKKLAGELMQPLTFVQANQLLDQYEKSLLSEPVSAAKIQQNRPQSLYDNVLYSDVLSINNNTNCSENMLSFSEKNHSTQARNALLQTCSKISLKISHVVKSQCKTGLLFEQLKSGVKIGRTKHNTRLINDTVIHSANDFINLLSKLRGHLSQKQALQLRAQLNKLKESRRIGNEEISGTALTLRAFANRETVFPRQALVMIKDLRTLCRDKGGRCSVTP